VLKIWSKTICRVLNVSFYFEEDKRWIVTWFLCPASQFIDTFIEVQCIHKIAFSACSFETI